MSGPAHDTDLFGNRVDKFASAKERYGIWPTTIWPVDLTDPTSRALKKEIGDAGQERDGSFGGSGCYDIAASIFNPQVAQWLLNCFAPKRGLCVDPFGGGGTRAIMVAKHGLRYRGTELRGEEVDAVRKRIEGVGLTPAQAEIIHADARFFSHHMGHCTGDFLLTCPPYWTLERYGGGAADLSEMDDYGTFLRAMDEVVRQTSITLRPGAASCWVIGLTRHTDGSLAPLHHDLTAAHLRHGFKFREEIILEQKNTGAIQRIGNFDKGENRLIRVHEYAMVYTAGGGFPDHVDDEGTASARQPEPEGHSVLVNREGTQRFGPLGEPEPLL